MLAEPALRTPEEDLAAAPPASEPAPAPPLLGDPPAEQAGVERAAPEPAAVEEIRAGEPSVGELPGEAAPDVYVWTDPEDADEDEGWEDEDDDLDGPDPFIRGEPVEDEPFDVDLEARRSAARAEALEGEQRVYLHMPAGPGSLAEALNQLLAEGLVQAEFVEGGDDEPHILYRPVK